MEFTYYGHACFEITVNEKKLLFDPFITLNPLAKHINIENIKTDYILITHAHSDHIADAELIANNCGASIIAPDEICSWLEKKGIKKSYPLAIGGKIKLDFGTVKMVVAQHSSSFKDGAYGGTPSGFVITSKQGNFYYSGDTGLTMDMQLIPKFAKIDFAILPIGDKYTMDFMDALSAAKMVECKSVIGVHYNTFEYIKIDKGEAQKYFNDNGISLLLPAIGETINIR